MKLIISIKCWYPLYNYVFIRRICLLDFKELGFMLNFLSNNLLSYDNNRSKPQMSTVFKNVYRVLKLLYWKKQSFKISSWTNPYKRHAKGSIYNGFFERGTLTWPKFELSLYFDEKITVTKLKQICQTVWRKVFFLLTEL